MKRRGVRCPVRGLTVAGVLLLAVCLSGWTALPDTLPTGSVEAGVHDVVLRAVLGDSEDSDLAATLGSEEEADRFRRWLYDEVGSIPNHRLRAEFYARYPSPTDFDARAFKIFLMVNPATPVVGLDPLQEALPERAWPASGPAGGATWSSSRHQAVLLGARAPTLDQRSWGRIYQAANGEPILGAAGDTVPFDPLVLNLGPLTGPTSDTHALLSLHPEAAPGDFGAMEREPWRVAVPFAFGDSVAAYARDNVQLYTDLALFAELQDDGAFEGLAALFAGNALYYLASSGDPLNTSQIGTASLHEEVRSRSFWQRARTLFGLFGSSELEPERGALDRAAVYRMFGGALLETELLRAERGGEGAAETALDQARTGDAGFRDELDAFERTRAGDAWGLGLAGALTDAAYRPGAEAFDLLAELSNDAVRELTVAEADSLADETWADRYLRDPDAERTRTNLNRLLDLQGAALARVHAASDLWWDRFSEETGASDADARVAARQRVLARLVDRQLDYLSQAEVRRARYMMTQRGNVEPEALNP